MDRGRITGFYGNEIKNKRELPTDILGSRITIGYEYELDHLLPFDAWAAGMHLRAFESTYDDCPYCLYDRWGRIVKQWPDNYVPSTEDIEEAAFAELRVEGRNV